MEIVVPKIKPIGHFPGEDIFPGSLPYGAVLLVGFPGEGKSTMLYNIVRKMIADSKELKRDLRITLICPSAFRDGDPTYEIIERDIKAAKVPFEKYMDTEDVVQGPKGGIRKISVIGDILKRIEEEAKISELEDDEGPPTAPPPTPTPVKGKGIFRLPTKSAAEVRGAGSTSKEDPRRSVVGANKKAPQKKEIYRLVIFDDIPEGLKDEALGNFIKRARHYKTRVILSSQDLKDPTKAVRNFTNQCIVSGGFDKERLETLYSMCAPKCTFEEFQRKYNEITRERHQFMNYNKNTRQVCRNFENNFTSFN